MSKQTNTPPGRIHNVRGGYYFLNDVDMLYWFPNKPGKNYGPGTGSKQLLMIYCPAADWAKVQQER